MRGSCGLLVILAIVGSGCHTTKKTAAPKAVAPYVSIPEQTPANELTASEITPFEPDYKKLPLTEPAGDPPMRKPPRGIDAKSVVELAGTRVTVAKLLKREDELPAGNDGGLLKELRGYAAEEAKTRQLTDALVAFYQLADAEGRSELLRQSMKRIDELREAAAKAKANGVRIPVEPEEIDGQKGQLRGILGQAEMGATLLEIDLLRRLGLAAKSEERLRPTGDFTPVPVKDDPADLVKRALEQRGDLKALRTAYLQLNAENLPAIREYLRGQPGGDLLAVPLPPIPGLRHIVENQKAKLAAAANARAACEVEHRRAQLFAIIEEKERATADEVRAALVVLTEQESQIGLARAKAESQIAKLADLKKLGKGVFAEIPAEIEVLRARAEVVAAIMAWHQASVRLSGAMGE